MTLSESVKYKHERAIPVDPRTAELLGHYTRRLAQLTGYSPMRPSLESVKQLDTTQLSSGASMNWRSRLVDGHLDLAEIEMNMPDEKGHLKLITNKQLQSLGLWETPLITDSRQLHDNSDVLTFLSEHLSNSPLLEKYLDLPDVTGLELHRLCEEQLHRKIGAYASIVTEYHFDIGAAKSTQPLYVTYGGVSYPIGAYKDHTTAYISSAYRITPDHTVTHAYDVFKMTTPLPIGDRAVHQSRYVVTGPDGTKIGIRSEGNHPSIPDYVDSDNNELIISSITERIENLIDSQESYKQA